MNLQNASFVTSCASNAAMIRDGKPQIVFAGRSNVGKSSVINCLLRRKNFARVGSQRGKTVHINYFNIDDKAYFVDLPGYGYAQVSQAERARWGQLIEAYFAADLITFGVMIVDARHKPTANDITMAECFKNAEQPFVVVANKLDKLKKSEIEPNLAQIRSVLTLPDEVPVLPFSAEKGTGRDELVSIILRAAEPTV
jgi:GTP-binding protein